MTMRWLTALLLTTSAFAHITAPIHNKLSAEDLPSAESILEVHEREKGRDAHYLDGLVWVTRGAVLLGARDRAADLQSQLLAQAKGRETAVAYLDAQLALVGTPAPPIVLDESLTPNPPTPSSLRGKPVLIFGWAQWCADCRAQVAALGRIRAKYADKAAIVTLTRYYETEKTAEKAATNKVCADSYQPLHGVSSTPTFILLDKNGKVAYYLPYRLTEAALEKLLRNP